MSEHIPESQFPNDPFPDTETLNWYQLNIRYGERPKGAFRAAVALLGPAIIGGAIIGAAELFPQNPNSAKSENSTAEIIHSNIPSNELGKMAVDVTMFEGIKPQIEWSQYP